VAALIRGLQLARGRARLFVRRREIEPNASRRRVKELSVEHSGHNLLQAGSQTAISDRMRELLARAAQDHVYEQRTQGAVLDEIRQRLEGMEWLLREVRERELGALNAALDAVDARLDELALKPPSWAEGLAQHMELLRDHVDAVSSRTQGLAEHMTEFARRLAQFQASMEAAAGRFTRLDKALAALTERTERLEMALLDRLDAVGEHNEVVGEQVSRLPSEMKIGELRTAVAGLGTSVEGVRTGVQGLGSAVESMDARVAGLRTGVVDVTARVGEMSAVVYGMNAEVGTAGDAIAPLVEAVRGRPDREQIAGSVTGAVAALLEPARGDVSGRLAALEETMLALAEALLRPTRAPGE
jgi:chromosome segregation ATPase